MPRFDHRAVLELFDARERLIALVVLVIEAFLLTVMATTRTAEWYVVFLGVIPLIMIIAGVLFRRKPAYTSANEQNAIELKIGILRGKLSSKKFQPDIIIGLSRGGLVVAAHLSYELKLSPPIPTISLWPHLPTYDNPLNSFDLCEIYEMQRKALNFEKKRAWNILIIDDACKSGRSLENARRHVEQQLLDIKCQVRTAALEMETGTHTYQIEPDFFASAEIA